MKLKSWRPTKPTSKGATAYHDAVIDASWHKKNVDELINIVHKHIKDNDIVVDFGAGTGGSAVYFLKHVKKPFTLWLVDNSPSWLGKAYEVLGNNANVTFSLLERIKDRYAMLDQTIGEKAAHHIISANTVHLIPHIEETFKGIHKALKPGGTFTFQSGNIFRDGREEGILMIDHTVNRVHDIALELILTDKKFAKYKKGLHQRKKGEESQRKIVFPDPRPIEYYLENLQSAGFVHEEMSYKRIRVAYNDWLSFLRVKRLQAGILPEIGGKEATPREELDRDELITRASLQLFKDLEKQNPYADSISFTAEWTYVKVTK